MIKVENLSIKYANVLAVDMLSIDLPDGNVCGLVGPNGAGKGSLVKALVGIVSEYSGTIYHSDLRLKENRHHIKKLVGYAPEDVELIPYLSGREFLEMIAEIRNAAKADDQLDQIIAQLGLEAVSNELIARYSHGMKQKISLAAALVGSPRTIILDEALNGLDPLAMYNMKKIIHTLAQEGHLIILSSHVLELIENWCQLIFILHQGKLIARLSQQEIKTIKEKEQIDFNTHFVNLITGGAQNV